MDQTIQYNDDWAAIDEARNLPEAWVFEDIENSNYVIVSDPAEADRLANMDPETGDWSVVWSSVGGLADV